MILDVMMAHDTEGFEVSRKNSENSGVEKYGGHYGDRHYERKKSGVQIRNQMKPGCQ